MEARDRPVLHWFVFCVIALAAGNLAVATWTLPTEANSFFNAITAFVVLGVLAEAGFLRLGRSGSTSSVAFIPHLAAVLLFPVGWAMAIGVATMIVAETAIRRKAAVKVVFNASKEALSIGLAATTYSFMGGQASLTEFSPSAVGFIAASLVYFLLNQTTSIIAIALSTGAALRQTWRKMVGGSLIFDVVTGPIAILLSWLYIRLDLIGVLIVIVPLFVVRHLYQINLKLEQVNEDLLHLMVKAIEARDPYTSGHSVRVSKIARVMAQECGLSARLVDEIATAALLHDVGKIHEEYASLLRKEGKLQPHEERMMQSHPVRSAELVSTISTMKGGVEEAVKHHHEHFDGTGYPDRLTADEIPIGSRIIAIADTVDAMTTDRPYRKALPYARVTTELERHAGRQFDPEFVSLFVSSEAVQRVVETHLSSGAPPFQPKTVAETLDDLRKAMSQVPGSMAGGPVAWRRRRDSTTR